MEGITFETGKPKEIVINTLVQIITQDGYQIDSINEKYGLINCKSLKILT